MWYLIEHFAANFQATPCSGVPLEILTVTHTFQKNPAFHEPQKAHYHVHQDTPQYCQYRNSLWATQSGDQIAVQERFSAPIQTSPATHPASYNMVGIGSFPGLKRLGCGIHHPPPLSIKVKERAELYLYSPWQYIGWTLPFPLKQHTTDLCLKPDEFTLYPHTPF